jgi:hypothetical protein
LRYESYVNEEFCAAIKIKHRHNLKQARWLQITGRVALSNQATDLMVNPCGSDIYKNMLRFDQLMAQTRHVPHALH